MKGINISIANSLKAKRAAALKGAVSLSSTSSNESTKSVSDDDDVLCIDDTRQDAENLSDADVGNHPRKKKGGTLNDGKNRAESRVKKTNTRFRPKDWRSNPRRSQPSPALSEE